jgi:hypothetical protein
MNVGWNCLIIAFPKPFHYEKSNVFAFGTIRNCWTILLADKFDKSSIRSRYVCWEMG